MKHNNTPLIAILITICIAIVYSHTLDYPFFFDDKPNIIANKKLHQDSVYEIDYKKILFEKDNQVALRPVAYLTFAINWLISGRDTTSYHIFNIIIHICTALILLKTIYLLFDTPAAKKKEISKEGVVFTAVFTTLLWALNPIQIQAVTYIVQRMAALAGMFSILSLFFYLKARSQYRPISKKSILLYLFSCLSFLLAFYSKENAAILPLFVLLIEFIFFKSITFKNKKTFYFLLGSIAFILLFAEFFSARDIVTKVTEGYQDRPFSLYERFLTEFRIIIFYLTQIFYPIPQRLSLLHNPQLSTSILSPVTTLFSIALVLLLVVFAVIQKHRFPFISFAILFYMAGHLVESTIIPLELVFEHRNYLPSMFLFLPVAYYLCRLIDFYRSRNRFIELFLYSFIVLLIIGFGSGTYIRNLAWSSQETLWSDSIEKADTMRAWHNLAFNHYRKIGKHEKEKELYLKALEKNNVTKISAQSWTYQNLASLYFDADNYEKSQEYWIKALQYFPEESWKRHKVYMGLSMVKASMGDFPTAMKYIDQAIEKMPQILYYNLKGMICMRMDQDQKALEYFRKGLRKEPHRWEGWYFVGAFLTQTGNYDRGYWFLRQSVQKEHVDYPKVMLYLIENRIKAGDTLKATEYSKSLLGSISYGEVLNKITHIIKTKRLSMPLDVERVLRVLEQCVSRENQRFLSQASASGTDMGGNGQYKGPALTSSP